MLSRETNKQVEYTDEPIYIHKSCIDSVFMALNNLEFGWAVTGSIKYIFKQKIRSVNVTNPKRHDILSSYCHRTLTFF